jgi:hypothetical protein
MRRRRVRRGVASRVRDDLVDGLLAVRSTGRWRRERAVAEFSARWTSRLVAGVTVGGSAGALGASR